MHPKVFGKVTTKKEKNDNKKKKKTGDWPQFLIDFLLFSPQEKKSVYISEKMDRPQNWLEMIGWKAFWLKK